MPPSNIRQYVEAIPGTPLPHGLVSAATVVEATNPHEMLGVEWEPLTCGMAGTTDWCVDGEGEGEGEGDGEKDFDQPGVETAGPVTVYYGTRCPPVGIGFEDARNRATAGLLLGEQKALESWFWTNVLSVRIEEDLTPPSGPIPIVPALGMLEQHLAENYAGVGVIHAPVGLGAWIPRLRHEGARLTTKVGNRVVLGAGYGISVGAINYETNVAWLYASGPVILRREPSPTTLPGNESESVNIVVNDRVILAERTWVPAVECTVQAIRVDITP